MDPENDPNISKLEVLISREELKQRIEKLGQEITSDYQGKHL